MKFKMAESALLVGFVVAARAVPSLPSALLAMVRVL